MSSSSKRVSLIGEVRGNMSKELQKIGDEMRGTAAGAVALAAAVGVASKKLADAGAQLYDTAMATGVSVETIQALGYVLDQTGGNAEGAGNMFRALNNFLRSAATGTKEYLDVLDNLGLSYDDLIAQSPEQTFMDITTALGKLEDVTQQNLASTVIFGGRYSQQVTGALRQTNGELQTMITAFQESGNAMSTDQVNDLKKYADALTDVKYAGQKMLADAIVPMIPILQENIAKFTPLAKDLLPELAEVGLNVVKALGSLVSLLLGGVEAVGGMKNAAIILTSAYIALRIATLQHALAEAAHASSMTIAAYAMGQLKVASAGLRASLGAAGLAAAVAFTVTQLNDLRKAINEAEEACRQNEEAVNRMSDATSMAADMIMAVNQTTNLTANTLNVFLDRLHAIDDGSEGVATAIAFMERKLAELNQASADGVQNVADLSTSLAGTGVSAVRLTQDTAGLTEEMIKNETAAIDTAIANLMLQETFATGPTVIAAQIAALREYRTQLEEIGSVGRSRYGVEGDVDTGANGGAGDEEAMSKVNRLVKAEFEARTDAEAEYDAMLKANELADQARILDGIRQKREQGLAAERDIADAQAAKQLAARESLQRWAEDFGVAMMSGAEGAKEWGKQMLEAIKKVVMEKGFSMIINLLTGGGSGFLGGVASFLGFSGGGMMPQGAGGLTMPLLTGAQGDTSYAKINPKESVLTPTQMSDVREYGGSRSSGSVVINFSSMFGASSQATQAEFTPFVIDVLKKSGWKPS